MMADNDFNIIKPVESLQNIEGLTPLKRRSEKKRRQNLHDGEKQESEQKLNESVDEQQFSNKPAENEGDQHTIDYRA